MVVLLREVNCSKLRQWTNFPSGVSSWLCLQLFLHLVFIQSGMLVVVMGLHLESISVPQSGIRGKSVTLGCEYKLDEGEKLYSLKWYKDSHEFYRLMPQHMNPTQVFPQPGVLVGTNDYMPRIQNKVKIELRNLGLLSAGTYKCEVSADAPTFKTLSKESNLTVIVIPNNTSPILEGFTPDTTYRGMKIRGNCSFSKSYPPAKLIFYVNGAKVNNSDDVKVKVYEPFPDGDIKEDSSYYTGSSQTGASSSNGIGRQYQYHQQNQQISSSSLGRDGVNSYSQLGGIPGSNALAGGAPSHHTVPQKTYTSVTEIDFRLDRQHFQQDGQFLNIRCVAIVVDQMWDTQTSIPRHRSQPSTYSSTGHNPNGAETLRLEHQYLKLGLLIISWKLFSC